MHTLAPNRNIFLSLLFCLVAVVLATPFVNGSVCQAADKARNDIIFILDASGSMAAQVQGKPKIDIAKEVLANLIKELPETAYVGLVAYGHRQKGDCADVEELAPLGSVNKATKEMLATQINGLKPKGMTPLTYSVQKVAEGLPGKSTGATIVLVSDGEETCKGDPCAAVRELKKTGAQFVLHVIGFDVNDKQKKQLNCIAAAGGGYYFTARNAGELKLAAQQAVEKKEPPKSTLTVKALRNGQPLRARCEVTASEGAEGQPGRKIDEGMTDKGSKVFTLGPGTYDLKVENSEDASKPTISFQNIILEPGQQIEKIAEFSGGTLMVKALRNGLPISGSSALYKGGSEQEQGREKITDSGITEKGKEFQLAPGRYEVTVEERVDANHPSLTFKDVQIEAGKTVEKIAEFSGGTLKVKALKNGKPLQAFCLVYRADTGEDKEKEKIAEARIDLEGTAINLTPGSYDVVVVDQEDQTRPTVSFLGLTLEAGKAIEKTADFSGGELKISAIRNGKPFSARLFVTKAGPAGETKKETVVNDYTQVQGRAWKLVPGTYDVRVINQEDASRPELTFPGVVVAMGKTTEKTAEFLQGELKITALRDGKPFSARLFVTTVPPDTDTKKETVVNDHTQAPAKGWKLSPGTYEARVVNQEDNARPEVMISNIVVEAGKTTEKTAEFSQGELKITALRDGKPFSARLFVTTVPPDIDTKKETVVNDHTQAPAKGWKLSPGTYEAKVVNQEDNARPEVMIANIVVEAGKTTEKTAEFSQGELKISALRNGKPFSARLFVTTMPPDAETRKQTVVNDHTQAPAKGWKLSPGTYEAKVVNQEDNARPEVTIANIVVEAGKTTEKTAEFSQGELKITALRDGKPFSARLYVTTVPSGAETKKQTVINDNTQAPGKAWKLSPGTYEAKVVQQETRAEQIVSGIVVEAGKLTEKTVEFPAGGQK